MSDQLSRISTILGSREHTNPQWPPLKNNYIAVRRDNGHTFVGVVQYIGSNRTKCGIRLLNGMRNPNPEEIRYILKPGYDPVDFKLVIETDSWTYMNPELIDSITSHLKYNGYSKLSDNLTGREMVFSRAIDRPVTLQTAAYHDAKTDPDIAMDDSDLIDLNNISGFEFLDKNNIVNYVIDGSDMTLGDDDIDDYIDDNIKNYRPEMLMIQENDRFEPPYDDSYLDVTLVERLYDKNKQDDLQRAANRIEDDIRKQLYIDENNEVYGDILFVYHNGYQHVLRKNIPLKEVVTEKLLIQDMSNKLERAIKNIELKAENVDTEKTSRVIAESEAESEAELEAELEEQVNEIESGSVLKILHDHLDKEINYNILKSILFNTLDNSLKIDQDILQEAEHILSLEYMIALNPEPRYHRWTFEKLIKIWYADIELTREIRMIKMLVNRFRARSDKAYNRENGVKPMIVIYPRYGKKSAMIVVQRLAYWFALFESAIAWKNNPPSFYKQMNDLIAYTNSNDTIKLYYRRKIKKYGKNTNNPYVDGDTRIRDIDNTYGKMSFDILHQYVPLNAY